MNEKVSIFLYSLLSRKFLLTVAGAGFFLYIKDYETAALLVGGYLAAEGIGDAAGRYSRNE